MSPLKMVLGGAVVVALVGAYLALHQKEQRDVSFGLSRDGKSVAFSAPGAGGDDIYTLDLPTLKVCNLTHSPGSEGMPAFSPDDSRVVYSATANGSPAAHLYAHTLTDGRRTQLTDDARANDDMASFSADGTQVVFERALRRRPYSMGGWTWDKCDVFLMRADGTGLRRLTSQGYYQVYGPKSTPDGRGVVFSAVDMNSDSIATNILRCDLAGKEPPKPLTSNGHSSSPIFTPDGEHIVYISDAAVPFEYEIWSMNPDGTHPTQPTHEHCDLEDPAVTPDGKHPRKLADSALFDDPLHWKPSQE